MGGQDGYSRTLSRYNEESDTVMGGIKIHPGSWNLGLSLGYTAATAGMDPFELRADDYVATHPSMSFDFSQSHTYSNIDVSRLDGNLHLKYTFNDGLWLRFWYRYVDYTDDDPYLYDTSGTVQWATVSAGWKF
jgi:hypothetical protein